MLYEKLSKSIQAEIHNCLKVSIAVTKHPDQSQADEERIYLA